MKRYILLLLSKKNPRRRNYVGGGVCPGEFCPRGFCPAFVIAVAAVMTYDVCAGCRDCTDDDDNLALRKCPQPPQQQQSQERVMCLCPFGPVVDENGCSTFECARRPESDRGDPEFSQRQCDRHKWCELGFRQYNSGQYACHCREERVQCADYRRCNVRCEYGFKKNEFGCEICRCMKPTSSKPCPQPPAHVKHDPRQLCRFGIVHDEYGCSTFRCAEQPITRRSCSRDKWCEFGFRKDVSDRYVSECRREQHDDDERDFKCRRKQIPACPKDATLYARETERAATCIYAAVQLRANTVHNVTRL